MKKHIIRMIVMALVLLGIIASPFVLLCGFIWIDNQIELSYMRSSNWDCDLETFHSQYYSLYYQKLQELKSTYQLDCEEIIERREAGYSIYLYDDSYTIVVSCSSSSECGSCFLGLTYYNPNPDELFGYEQQRNLVNFINDFTNYVAFDARIESNEFELLYQNCLTIDKGEPIYSSNYIHFDNYLGNVGYVVCFDLEGYEESYFYKMQKDSTVQIPSVSYSFYGLLKPLDKSMG